METPTDTEAKVLEFVCRMREEPFSPAWSAAYRACERKGWVCETQIAWPS